MPDTDPLNTLVVYGSVRDGRVGINLARYLRRRIEARGGTAEIADPLELELPLLRRRFSQYAEGTAPEAMVRLAAMIRRADAFVIVAGEYNHGIPPALKNLLDHYLQEWFHRPAGIACYSGGRFGGVRSAMQLRMTLGELGMPTVSTLLPVPAVGKSVSPEGDDLTDWLTPASEKFLDELDWWATAARRQTAEAGPPF